MLFQSIKLPTEANPLPPVPFDSVLTFSVGAVMVHSRYTLTYLWERFRNSLHIHPTTHFLLEFTTGNFLQGIPNRLTSKLMLLYSVLPCVVFFRVETTLLVSTLFFKPFELMLLLCLTLGLLRGAMLSTWLLKLVTLQCVMLPYALHVFQD